MAQGDETLEGLARRMASIHISRIDEMPRIELYLDQVLSIVCGELAFMALPGEELLTGSMVNNYVKQRVVPAPAHRRYTRRHVATLLFVCAFKRVFSIAEIRALYGACVERGVDVAATYDELVAAVERAVAQRFSGLSAARGSEGATVAMGGGDAQVALVAAAQDASVGASAPVSARSAGRPPVSVRSAGRPSVSACAVPAPRPAPAVTLRDAAGSAVAPDLDRIMSAGVEAVADKVFVEQVLALHEYNPAR